MVGDVEPRRLDYSSRIDFVLNIAIFSTTGFW